MIKFILGPRDELTADVARFVAKANCAIQVRELAEAAGPFEPPAISRLAKSLPSRGKAFTSEARSRLRSAWQHELAARVHAFVGDPTVLRIGSHALPVTAYYALFNGFRAWAQVQGIHADRHTQLQRTFSTQFASSLPLPWGARLNGDPASAASCTLERVGLLPPPLPTVNPVAYTRHSTEEMLLATLRMARKWMLDTQRERWLANNKTKQGIPRKKLPAGARAKLVAKLWPTTLLDFVYGMRVRSNYQQIDEYVSEPKDWNYSDFHRGMAFIVHSGLLMAETHLAALVGLDDLEREATSWADSVSAGGEWATRPVLQRIEAIATYGAW